MAGSLIGHSLLSVLANIADATGGVEYSSAKPDFLCPQAVLESKWPSTSQGGRLRWAKLRNALLAVAQFRQPIKRRQKSGSVGSRGGNYTLSLVSVSGLLLL